MSDQPTDRDRPPRYGGPRNRARNAPDSARRDRTDSPRRTRGEPTRRPPDHPPKERGESQPPEDTLRAQHSRRIQEPPPPRDRSRTRDHPSSRSQNLPQRPSSQTQRGSQRRRYTEAYQPSPADEPHRETRRTSTPEQVPHRDRQRPEGREALSRTHALPVDQSVDPDLLEAFEALEFETDAQKRVYRYVERRGIASREEVGRHVDLSADSLSDAIRRLERKEYLEERDGTLRVAHNTDVEMEFAVAGVDVTIRPARQEDLADLVALIRTVTDERTYVVAESVAAQLAYEEAVIRHTDARSRMFFVATVDADDRADAGTATDSRLVGWAHLTLPGVEHLDHTAELTVGVRADFRRRGIGSRLVQIALAWAAANDYHKVYQSLPGTNLAAIDFLDAHGWTTEAIRPDHYRIDGEFVDEVMMAVTL